MRCVWLICCFNPGVRKVSVKGQAVNILGVAGHRVSVTTPQSCTVGLEQPETHGKEWMWMGANKTLFTKLAWAAMGYIIC